MEELREREVEVRSLQIYCSLHLLKGNWIRGIMMWIIL